MSRWTKPTPPVVVVSGDHTYLRRREVQRALAGAGKQDRTVERLDGSEHMEILHLMTSTGVLFPDQVMALVTNPNNLDPGAIIGHHESRNNMVTFLLHHEGRVPTGKKAPLKLILDALPKKFHVHHEAWKPWKADENAATFCVQEAKGAGKKMDPKLARMLVSVAGHDIGILSFEMVKLIALAESHGSPDITKEMLGQTVSRVGKASTKSLVDAVAVANADRVLRALNTLRRSFRQPPTMMAAYGVGNAATKWLQAASYDESSVPPAVAAKMVGVHEFTYQKTILPVARRWGSRSLKILLQRIAEVTRAVRQGHQEPWVELQCNLFKVCRAVSAVR